MRGGLAWLYSSLQEEMPQWLKFCAFRLNISGVSRRLTLRRAKINRLLSAEQNCLLFRCIHMFRSFTIIIGPTPQLQFLYVKVLFNNSILRFNILTLLLHILTSLQYLFLLLHRVFLYMWSSLTNKSTFIN